MPKKRALLFLCGGHLAHWNEWTEKEYFLSCSPKTGVSTLEGFLQLSLYFKQWSEIIRKNHWHPCMTQTLADEPQETNAETYRILSCICRKFMPGTLIIDAVETANLGGALDIWVPKQGTYEKNRKVFQPLQDRGENLGFYTCAFPAGDAQKADSLISSVCTDCHSYCRNGNLFSSVRKKLLKAISD